MLDLAVINGTVVSPEGQARLDVGVDGGRVVLLAAPGSLPAAAETIDATGLLVLPGTIDSHFHCRAPSFPEREDFASGTRAAAAGGVTTVLEMPISVPPTTDGATLADAPRPRPARCLRRRRLLLVVSHARPRQDRLGGGGGRGRPEGVSAGSARQAARTSLTVSAFTATTRSCARSSSWPKPVYRPCSTPRTTRPTACSSSACVTPAATIRRRMARAVPTTSRRWRSAT